MSTTHTLQSPKPKPYVQLKYGVQSNFDTVMASFTTCIGVPPFLSKNQKIIPKGKDNPQRKGETSELTRFLFCAFQHRDTAGEINFNFYIKISRPQYHTLSFKKCNAMQCKTRVLLANYCIKGFSPGNHTTEIRRSVFTEKQAGGHSLYRIQYIIS